MKTKLTEKALKTLCPAAKPYEVVDEAFPGFLLRVEPSGRMSFYLSYYSPAGARKRIRLGQYGAITLTQAKELAKVHAAEIAKGNDPQEMKKERIQQAIKDQSRTLGEYIKADFGPWILKSQKSAAHTLMLLVKYFSHFNELDMQEINTQRIERWQLSELDRGMKPATIERSLNALRAVLTRAHKQGVLEPHPLKGLRKLEECDEKRIRYLSSSERAALHKALQERDREIIEGRSSGNAWRAARGKVLMPDFEGNQYGDYLTPLVILALNTGLRRGELFQLRWMDIDMSVSPPLLTVRAAYAKTRRARHIPLNPTSLETLKLWRAQAGHESDLVFPSPEGGHLVTIKTAWGRLMKRAGIIDFRFHDLRHTFASALVMSGAHLNTVRELLGHADFKTTLRYAHLGDDHKAAAVALIG